MNMADLTDTFMTAAVLASVATGLSKFTGIANQRVKECNRIAVMVEELSKLGVQCGELDDGIWIEGTNGDIACMSRGSFVDCHKDHRIAMSFAVLGSLVPGIVITDKLCVGKTYAEFWEDVENRLGLRLEDHDVVDKFETGVRKLVFGDSLILIGMRGVGKSTIGKYAASRLGYKFIDLDQELTIKFGMPLKDFVDENGWPAFRRMEASVCVALVTKYPKGYIISCGGGVIETLSAVTYLQSRPGVVLLTRDIADIEKILADSDSISPRARLPEPLSSVWNRRRPLFVKASSYEFVIRQGDFDWSKIQVDLELFLRRILGLDPVDLHHKSASFFLSLTYPKVDSCLDVLGTICQGCDAVELRVDKLDVCRDVEKVALELALLKRHLNSLYGNSFSVIFTVRTIEQGGNLPSEEKELIFQLLKQALRMGVEYVDLEIEFPASLRAQLCKVRGNSKFIMSYHDIKTNGGGPDDLRHLFEYCHTDYADVVKVVVTSQNPPEDVLSLMKVQADFEHCHKMPSIALAMGKRGQLSRVLNQVLTPVTHPALPSIAAPGQLSVKQINSLRISLGLLDEKKFSLIGYPIQLSSSPSMHNAAFRQLELPFEYGLFESNGVDEKLLAYLRDPAFGGASVTMPMKEKLFDLVDEISESVREIGSLNVLHRRRDGKMFADNTDWIGIYRVIEVNGPYLANSKLPALVIGGGGTAKAAVYALKKLGLQVSIFNRTHEKAHALAQRFGIEFVPDLDLFDPSVPLAVLVNTVAASAGWTAPENLLKGKPFVFDVNYLPPETKLGKQAAEHGCKVLRGIDMLIEQGIAAFEIWTGRKCPAKILEEGAFEFYSKVSASTGPR
eukprot:TRINITY_DN12100_c0_g1_i3.p1 TRINITY_DN12100_c0_g1~~TRINITY_DN12100_c0_g1_i3.p1  ORF type:complete len:936 (-),score=276.04 TRINITY_DN12100_c0_g1_i3:87-2621(-)